MRASWPTAEPTAARTGGFRRVVLDAVSVLDQVLFGEHPWVALPAAEQQHLRRQLVRESFAWHVERCAPYGDYARRRGVTPDTLGDGDDLSLIPQLPTAVFKHETVCSVRPADVVRGFTSSGTSGRRSIVARDAISLHRLMATMRPDDPLIADLFGASADDEIVVLNLGPSRAEAGELWFAFVMSLLEQVAPMSTYVRGDEFLVDEALDDLHRSLDERETVVLAGPPFLVAGLVQRAFERGLTIRGGRRLAVFTGGGWKTHEDEAVEPNEFRSRVVDALGLTDASQVRDVFNQVEMNTLLVDCEAHEKHVPPWLEVFARHPLSFERLPNGEPGVLTFYDASARSYPAFVVGDDLGRVDDGRCACGRAGLRLRVDRRVLATAHEGCGRTLTELISNHSDDPGRR